jgi:ADP-ribosylglycohydrolase
MPMRQQKLNTQLTALRWRDRAAGALMGAFIGDALALGPHWYYDLDELRAATATGSRTTPTAPDHYHAGMKAGESSQAGVLLRLTLESLAERGGYDEADFCRRLDEDFFPQIDGTPMQGPGGYTSQSIREAWRKRVQQGLPWGQVGGNADTTEAAERTLAIAVRYALDPAALADAVTRNTVLTQTDGTVVAMTVAFGAVLGMLVEGQCRSTRRSRQADGAGQDRRAALPHRDQRQPAGAARPAPPRRPPPAASRRRTRCSRRPRSPARPATRTCASSRRGRCRWCMACPARCITSSRRPITWRRASPTTSSRRCCTRSMAAGRTWRGRC